MDNCFVLNSSPLISLSKAGLQVVLERLNVIIPQNVANELRSDKYFDEARAFIDNHPDKIIATYTISDEIKTWGLGSGESSVLAIVLTYRNWVAVIDDGAARKCAKVYNLKLTGTLGLLLIAYRLRIIKDLQSAIFSLRDAGLYLDKSVIETILKATMS
jgi:predicted nucleic acid-binding protein